MPDLMARHPQCAWSLLSGVAVAGDLLLSLRLRAAPDRQATVRVLAGAEIYVFAFAGAESVDFAYADADKPEALQDRIALAVRAMHGPTRLIRDRVGGSTLGATLVLDIDGAAERVGSDYPLRRLRAFLTRGRVEREVVDYPAVDDH